MAIFPVRLAALALAVALVPPAVAEPARAPQSPPWPLWRMRAPDGGLRARLSPGESLAAMDLDPRGSALVFAARTPSSTATSLRVWDFRKAPVPLAAADLDGRRVEALVFGAFDASLFILSSGAADWRIESYTLGSRSGKLVRRARLVTSSVPLAGLVTALLKYDDAERIFYGREYSPASQGRPARYQVMSMRGDGTGVYEVTSPTGKPTELTDPTLITRKDPDSEAPPATAQAVSAVPVSLGPQGTLIWRADDEALFSEDYVDNWQPPKAILPSGPGVDEVETANGYFRLRWTRGDRGVELVARAHQRREVLAAEASFVSRPVLASNGRALVGEIREGGANVLRTYAVGAPLAAVRMLSTVRVTGTEAAHLAHEGALFTPTDAEQIYQPYERLAYEDLGCGSRGGMLQPVFASLDGYFEVLNAGLEAVFVVAEQKVSRPALKRVLAAMKRVADSQQQARVAKIAEAATKVLAGDLDHPEGKLISAESSAPSSLPIRLDGKEVSYADFHPRGPYLATKELQSYFRAFKLINLLELTPEEKAALQADTGFISALKIWTNVQAPFLAGTRRSLLFDIGARHSSIPAECIPNRVKELPPVLYPIAWSLDSEVLEASVERPGVAPGCGTVPGRLLPTGLDLLAGLGSAKARDLNRSNYQRFPSLAAAHENLAKNAAVLDQAHTFVDSFLHLVQIMSASQYVPEAVSSDIWQRRLLQSALGAWVGLRHTLVLVDEQGSAECDFQINRFEKLAVEPARGTVDPIPAAWRQVAALLDALVSHARRHPASQGLAARLREVADSAREFGLMADKQLKDEPLTVAQYAAIESFAGMVEHPYLLFKSALKHASEADGVLTIPEPMMKIVDVQRSPEAIWHVATGRPLAALVLLGDRGVLLPSSGAVYSYYEVASKEIIDDLAWRARVDKAARPEWTAPLLQGRPKPPRQSPPVSE
jgi:hypothetical protein